MIANGCEVPRSGNMMAITGTKGVKISKNWTKLPTYTGNTWLHPDLDSSSNTPHAIAVSNPSSYYYFIVYPERETLNAPLGYIRTRDHRPAFYKTISMWNPSVQRRTSFRNHFICRKGPQRPHIVHRTDCHNASNEAVVGWDGHRSTSIVFTCLSNRWYLGRRQDHQGRGQEDTQVSFCTYVYPSTW